MNFEQKNVHLINVYFPAAETERREYVTKIISDIKPFLDNEYVILAGDINMLANTDLDYEGHTVNLRSSKTPFSLFKEKVLTDELLDVYRYLKPDGKDYSCHSHRAKTRIDNLFASTPLARNCKTVNFISVPVIAHDHLMVLYPFDMLYFRIPRGRGYWKLNVSLLEDQQYIALIHEMLENWSNKIAHASIGNKIVLWDLLKADVQVKLKIYAKEKAKYTKQQNKKFSMI